MWSTSEGDAVPMQMTRPLTTMSSNRGRLVFPVEVPPLGYRTYRVRKGAVEGEPLAAAGTTLENAHVLLELDPATGRIARLVLKATRPRPGRAVERARRRDRRSAATRGVTV